MQPVDHYNTVHEFVASILPTVMQLRHSHLVSVCFGLTCAVLVNAFYQKKQFYPSMVYLTKSNPSMAVLYVQGFVIVTILAKIFMYIFFGSLRVSEQENVVERAWFAVTETCLAFTVFRDDFNVRFVAQFTQLFFFKCFHWMAEERVDYMERTPVVTNLFCARMMGLVAVLSSVDSYYVSHAYFTTLLKGASVQIVFGFEYAILLTIVLQVAIKFTLYRIDSRSVHPWQNKAVYLLYTELIIEFCRVVLYAFFVGVMMHLHAFPLFSIRPMYMTIKSFKKAVMDAIMSRRAINNMNTLYPDVSADELRDGEIVCIICREEITGNAKKLPCNHVYHTACLRSWFQRQQTCPTCRLNVLDVNNTAQTMPARQDGANVQQNAAANQQQPLPPQNNAIPNMPVFPPFWLPGAQQGQPAAAAAAAVNQAAGGAQPGGSVPLGGMLPPFLPPFPNPPDFSGLTDEEVRQMEGVERLAVEARIQCLRNIGTLLDAAVVQLQQYTTVLGSYSPFLTAPFVGSSASVPGTSQAPNEPAQDSQEEIRKRRLQHLEQR